MTDYRGWLERRKSGIGSSDAPLLVLKKLYGKTPLDLYIEKRTPVPADITRDDDNPNFRRGHEYEPKAIDLLAAELGIEIYRAKDDAERFREWGVGDAHPGYQVFAGPHIYADFDGLTADPEDAWVVEAKSPSQRECDRMRAEGVNDYYLVQCGQLAHVAHTVGTFAWPAGKCKGVILVIYEPEKIAVQVLHIPYDPQFCCAVVNAGKHFWATHVAAGNPPVTYAPPAIKVKKAEGAYAKVDGPSWADAGARYRIAKDAATAAKARLEFAQETLEQAMQAAKLERVLLPDGQKYIYAQQNGRRSLDDKLLRHEHPEIDWARYERQGEPFWTFRAYGVKDTGIEVDHIDGQIAGLASELASLPQRQLDPAHAAAVWDDLRARTDLYTRMLRAEADDLDQRLTTAGEDLASAMTRR